MKCSRNQIPSQSPGNLYHASAPDMLAEYRHFLHMLHSKTTTLVTANSFLQLVSDWHAHDILLGITTIAHGNAQNSIDYNVACVLQQQVFQYQQYYKY